MISTNNLWAFSLLGRFQKSLYAQPFEDLLVSVLYILVKYGKLVKERQVNLHQAKGNAGESPNLKYMSELSIVSANKHPFLLLHISYSLNSVKVIRALMIDVR